MQIPSNPVLVVEKDLFPVIKIENNDKEDKDENEISLEEGDSEIRIREDNPKGEIRIKEDKPRPVLELHEKQNPKPNFIHRWSSFIRFVIEGSGMDEGIHLHHRFKIKDKIEIIDDPDNQPLPPPEGKKPVLDICEKGHENKLPSPMHIFYEDQHVRKSPGHITHKKDDYNIKNRDDSLPHYGKTVYTIDNIYRHTTIDDTTRQREFDFWHDKEVKTYTVGGVSLGVGIVAILVLPVALAVVVSGIAVVTLLLMAQRSTIATPQIYAWRDQLQEHYFLRQDIAAGHKYNTNGARKLFQKKEQDLIGKVFHPKEAWKFWEEEDVKHKTNFEKHIDNIDNGAVLDDFALAAFFRHNPYLSYEYIAGKLTQKPDNDVEHLALRKKYIHLERAFETMQRVHGELRADLATHKQAEENLKNGWKNGIDIAYNEMVGQEPEDKNSEEHKIWKAKEEKIKKINDHYINQGYSSHEKEFNKWHTKRDIAIQKSEDASREDICAPIWAWWELANDLKQEGWDINSVIITEKIHHKQPLDASEKNFPKPQPYKMVFMIPQEIEGVEKELIEEFTKIAQQHDPEAVK